MILSRSMILVVLVGIACLWAIGEYRVSAVGNSSPDVIVGDIPSIYRWGALGNETAFSIGTTSCNIGTARLDWIQNSTVHPVISQNMYRVKNGRIEQIGMSWLKHGFGVAAGNLCGICTDPAWNYLGVGCSDPYGATLNGSQSGLGPRSEVNAFTGAFLWPKGNLPSPLNTLTGRLRVLTSDINPSLNAGARYFVESHYVHPQDAAAGNDLNNASYREAFVSAVTGGWTLQTSGSAPTVRLLPAIHAWKSVHPNVEIRNVDIPNEGRIIVGVRTTPGQGGGYHTEFAMENLNSHQSVRSLGVKYGTSSISNPGFHDADYQFEPYSNVDWAPNLADNQIEWATETFANNPNANALRWNTLYSFWCDSELPPRRLTLGLFRPGTVDEMQIDLIDSVVPETFKLRSGEAAGQFSDVFQKDGQFFTLSPKPNLRSRKQTVEWFVQTHVASNSPADFAFALASAVSGAQPGEVIQAIELFNFDIGRNETVDVREASHTGELLEITPTGDWGRFIESGTNKVQARIEWSSTAEFSPEPYEWSINLDQAVWLFTP